MNAHWEKERIGGVSCEWRLGRTIEVIWSLCCGGPSRCVCWCMWIELTHAFVRVCVTNSSSPLITVSQSPSVKTRVAEFLSLSLVRSRTQRPHWLCMRQMFKPCDQIMDLHLTCNLKSSLRLSSFNLGIGSVVRLTTHQFITVLGLRFVCARALCFDILLMFRYSASLCGHCVFSV